MDNEGATMKSTVSYNRKQGQNRLPIILICSFYLVGVFLKRGILYHPSVGNGIYNGWLSLDFYKIQQGEWWRLLSFVLNPPGLTTLWSVLFIAYTYIIGREITELIGWKKITLYYSISFVVQIAIAAFFYFCMNRVIWMDLSFWGWSLFPVLAWIEPKKKVFLLTPFSMNIVKLLIIPGVLLILRILVGNYSSRINLSGQMISMILFLIIEIRDKKIITIESRRSESAD